MVKFYIKRNNVYIQQPHSLEDDFYIHNSNWLLLSLPVAWVESMRAKAIQSSNKRFLYQFMFCKKCSHSKFLWPEILKFRETKYG